MVGKEAGKALILEGLKSYTEYGLEPEILNNLLPILMGPGFP